MEPLLDEHRGEKQVPHGPAANLVGKKNTTSKRELAGQANAA